MGADARLAHLSEREREVVISPADDAPVGICLMASPDAKVVENRVHLDLDPGPDASPGERQAEIERLIALGARPVDIGQRGEETWTVLADSRRQRVLHRSPEEDPDND